jgi:hypothetical protein
MPYTALLMQVPRLEINHKEEKMVKEAGRVGEMKLLEEWYCHDFSDYRCSLDL